jgi:hypothetical protein
LDRLCINLLVELARQWGGDGRSFRLTWGALPTRRLGPRGQQIEVRGRDIWHPTGIRLARTGPRHVEQNRRAANGGRIARIDDIAEALAWP